jgi:hypothetical protein
VGKGVERGASLLDGEDGLAVTAAWFEDGVFGDVGVEGGDLGDV